MLVGFLCSSGGIIFVRKEECVSQRGTKVAKGQVQTVSKLITEKKY